MREFFRGWWWKIGCVTLVMACGLTSIWLRSVLTEDVMRVCDLEFKSSDGGLERSDFMFTDVSRFGSYDVRHVYWRLQYAWFAIPLTLLSAYLILWKPRKRV